GLPGLVPAVAGAAPVGGLDRRAGGALPGRAVTGAEPRFTGTPLLLPARSTAGGVAGTGRAGLPWPSCAVEMAIAVAVTAAASAVTTVLMPAPPNSDFRRLRAELRLRTWPRHAWACSRFS